MATAIYFGGSRINVPGAYSVVDASALAGLSPGAVGIVALIGTAEGGKPLTIDTTFSDFTRPEKVFETFRAGNLRKAGQFAFEPSNDEAIPGGAQRLVCVKVNPATQSTATLADAAAADAVDLTSADWGLFTAQINITVAAGTLQGKLITITFESTIETIDNVGGDAVIDIAYDADSGAGWDTSMTGLFSATQFLASASKAETGLVTERAADIPATGVVRVESDNAGDTTQTVTIYGLDGSNNAVSETLTLNGTTEVVGTQSFAKVIAAQKSAATTGTITVEDTVLPTTLFTLAPGTLTRGLYVTTNMPVADDLFVTVDTDDATDLILIGRAASGALTLTRVDLTSANTTPVEVTAYDGGSITAVALGDTAAARTVTLDASAIKASTALFTTVQQLTDHLNAKDGFTATAQVSNPTTFLLTDMDYGASPTALTTVAVSFYADLYEFITAVNQGSGLVTAARATGASQVPANTVSPVFLQGGSEGTPTITEWQSALDLLKKRRVNIIVPLTEDQAVHSALVSHLKFRAGKGRSEANGYVGIGTVGGAGETKSNLKSQIQVLGTRHVSALSQEVERFDPDTGLATWYPPWMHAVIAAGMQAGSPIGEPLTHKRPNVTDIRNDSSWTVEDDKEELIDAGLMIAEKVDGIGVRYVRSVTTHLQDDNLVFSEMSANESANTAIFELRTAMEQRIGKRALAGTVASLKGLASDVLGRLVDDEIIVLWRSLTVEQIGDVFPISVEIAPVVPINFIPITVHLVAVRAAA